MPKRGDLVLATVARAWGVISSPLVMCVVAVALSGTGVLGQSPYRNVLISSVATGPGYVPEEPTIVVDPNNSRHMLAGANLQGSYYSTNGGANWTVGEIVSPLGEGGDPCVVVDTNGYYYYFHLGGSATSSWIVCQQLAAPGAAWSGGSILGQNGSKFQDKPWATLDRQNSRIYAAWTQFDVYGGTYPWELSIIEFSSSGDGGQTWTAPVPY